MENYNVSQGNLSTDENIQNFFIHQLNRIYAAKLRMEGILDELLNRLLFSDLAITIRVTVNLVQDQLVGLKEIYAMLHVNPSFQKPNDMLDLIEEAYLGIQQQSSPTFSLSVLAYLQTVESLELASFEVLNLAAFKLNNSFISELLNQYIAESEADYKLLLTLMAKYIND